MTLSDLPLEVQNELMEKRTKLHATEYRNTSHLVVMVNKEGTRFFEAYRKNDFDGYGCTGGWWKVRYGKVLWDRSKQPLGNDYDYFWVNSSKTFSKSANGTEIPRSVHTKKEVIALAKAIGIFDI